MSKRKMIICSNEQKKRYLQKLEESPSLFDGVFFSKKEFLEKYYFTYTNELYFYLIHKYHWHLDVIRTYLQYMPVIDIKKNYQHEKLIFLQDLKKELLEEKLLIESPSFSEYLKNYDIEVDHIYDLDLYEEKALSYSVEVPSVSLKNSVYEFSTMEEEVNFVCLEILKLLEKGVSLSKIYLGNVTSDYYYTLKRYFSYYHIPINIPYQNSIYGTKEVQDFLNTKSLPEEIPDTPVYQKLIPVLEEYLDYDLEDEAVFEVLTDQLKHTYFPNVEVNPAVTIHDIYQEEFTSDETVFVMGFQQDILPAMKRDVDYIEDSLKKELDLYTTREWNQREKSITAYLFQQVPNLILSYKKRTPFQEFYPSSLIQDYSLEVIRDYDVDYHHSHFYNQLTLGKMLDQYYTYGEIHPDLEKLFSSYTIPYRTYSNVFKGISQDLYLENLPYPLRLSYTSFNAYNECRFKYYIQYVLKLNPYEDSFAVYIGSLYHKILSLYTKTHFDFEVEYHKYLENRDLTPKEKMLLFRIKNELLEMIEVLKKQQLLTGYNEALYEEGVSIPLEKKVAVEFVGYIDKIMFYKNMEDVYFSIIDYKSGTIDTHIEPMKYGLHMQLPIYLYLIHYGGVFKNPIFTGIYYQNILFNYPSWSEKLEKENAEKYYLQGYSTDHTEYLERFDSTYQDSTYIKSMKYTDKFGSNSKIIDDDTLFSMLQFTKNMISERTDDILNGDFSINPKVYGEKNISCRYCSFKDLCYKSEEDIIYLDKVDDLSFLGGEE